VAFELVVLLVGFYCCLGFEGVLDADKVVYFVPFNEVDEAVGGFPIQYQSAGSCAVACDVAIELGIIVFFVDVDISAVDLCDDREDVVVESDLIV